MDPLVRFGYKGFLFLAKNTAHTHQVKLICVVLANLVPTNAFLESSGF